MSDPAKTETMQLNVWDFATMRSQWKMYYQLTKPGIIYGNAITALAGFFLASKGQVNFGLFVATLIGISLVIAAACVFNNYIDRGIDKKMARTAKRALVSGAISERNALIYGAVLGVAGFVLLALYTNLLTVFLALLGMFFYVVVYGIGKRQSIYGTEVGSISGAIPIVVGYCAVTNSFDAGAWILFLIMVFWQMPHFYAIATYRLKDYASAGLPVLPVKKSMDETKARMSVYILAFMLTSLMLTAFGYAGYTYAAVVTALGAYWLHLALKGFETHDDEKWARKVFGFSLIIIMALSIMLSLNSLLP